MGGAMDAGQAPLRKAPPRTRRPARAAIAATPLVVVSDLPDRLPLAESEIHLVLGSLAALIDALFSGDP